MSVVNVWVMRVRMRQVIVAVRVGVRLSHRIIRAVRVAVVLIVEVGMGMLDELVFMPVLVALAQVKPQTQRHQESCGYEPGGHRITIQKKAQASTDEGSQREVRSSASGA